jgi:hypothetical protein
MPPRKDCVSNIVETWYSAFARPNCHSGSSNGSAASVVMNWVCCDACDKWRLLLVGVETFSLPKSGFAVCSIGCKSAWFFLSKILPDVLDLYL